PGWSELDPWTLTRRTATPDVELLLLCTFHPSGWVRAAALGALQARSPERSIPFWVIRLSDWVKAVRADAVRLCEGSIVAGNENGWVQGLALLELLGRSSRAPPPELAATALALLGTARGAAAWHEALRAKDALVRTFAFRSVLRSPDRTAEVVAEALVDP